MWRVEASGVSWGFAPPCPHACTRLHSLRPPLGSSQAEAAVTLSARPPEQRCRGGALSVALREDGDQAAAASQGKSVAAQTRPEPGVTYDLSSSDRQNPSLPTLTPELSNAREARPPTPSAGPHPTAGPGLAGGPRASVHVAGPGYASACCRLGARRPRSPSLSSVAWVLPPTATDSVQIRRIPQWKGQPGVWSTLLGVDGDSGSCGLSRPLHSQVLAAGETDVCWPPFMLWLAQPSPPHLPREA